MLTEQENDRISRVGPGTPMGELLRRYWQPIATVEDLEREEVMPVRRLGENLVLFKTEKGIYGLIQERCAHRSASLTYGIPHADGIRCPYHGWLYSPEGECLQQPYEETENPESTFREKIHMDAYPVEALGGLIWAYFGPEPRPLLPRWEILAREGMSRTIGVANLPANWLQCMENSLDPVHFEWLHANLINYVHRRRGEEPAMFPAHHKAIAFEVFEYGIYKRRLLDNQDPETSPDWLIGHPILFPNTLALGNEGGGAFQIRVPIDDYNTFHINYFSRPPKDGEQPQVEVRDVQWQREDGRLVTDTIIGTDMLAWICQGPITPRNLEHLGLSDRGIIIYRNMLEEAMKAVERGEDPPCLIRDEAKNYPFVRYATELDIGQHVGSFNIPGRERRGRTDENMGRARQPVAPQINT